MNGIQQTPNLQKTEYEIEISYYRAMKYYDILEKKSTKIQWVV